jgi:hypothetical protein
MRKLVLSAILVGIGLPVLAAQVAIAPSQDASVFENSEFGCGQGPLFAGQTGSFGIRRALLRFDVAAAVPSGSTIQSAALDFYVNQSGPSSLETDLGALHRVVADWGEGASVCAIGDGVPAEPGDATWTYSFYDTVGWITRGGDFAPTASASGPMPVFGSGTFSSTSGLVADVQAWLDTPAVNHGWILRGDEARARSARRILSREEQDEENSGPILRIVFAPPVTTPPAVPDLLLGKVTPAGADLQLTWDTSTCGGAADHHLLYGTGSGFPAALGGTYVLQGSVCDLGTSPPYTWVGSPDPAVLDPVRRLLFILVVADDDATIEGSWGHASQAVERSGAGANGASNQCGMLDKDLTNACGNTP